MINAACNVTTDPPHCIWSREARMEYQRVFRSLAQELWRLSEGESSGMVKPSDVKAAAFKMRGGVRS